MTARLFTTLYYEKHAARRLELELALSCNAGAFGASYVLTDSGRVVLPTDPAYRIVSRQHPQRQKFADLLAWAREVCEPSDLVVIANCDILIPWGTLCLLDEYLEDGEAFCLTRWEMFGPKAMQVWDVGYSQDVWAFRGPPRETIPGDFYFGVPGCDNRFSWEIQQAGYRVRNPSKSLPTWHVHMTRQRTQTNSEAYRVPPPYLYLLPCLFGEAQQVREARTMAERHQAFSERRRASSL